MKDGSEIQVLSLDGAENLAKNSDNAVSIYDTIYDADTEVVTKQKLIKVVNESKYVITLEQMYNIFKALRRRLIIDNNVIVIGDSSIELQPFIEVKPPAGIKKPVEAPLKKPVAVEKTRQIELFRYVLEFRMGSSMEKSSFHNIGALQKAITKYPRSDIIAVYKASYIPPSEYKMVEDLRGVLLK